jgi:hypothetical protein
MILVKRYCNGPYELHYRHCDGYPLGLGVELIEALKQGADTPEVLKIVGAENERGHPIGKVEDAFLKVQGDLEWLYEISDYNSEKDLRSLGIYKTSCPFTFKDEGAPDFVFRCFWSYVRYLPVDHHSKMEQVEETAQIALNALVSLEKEKLCQLVQRHSNKENLRLS